MRSGALASTALAPLALLMLDLALAVAACSGSTPGNCTPGATVSCSCPLGEGAGVSTCGSDGTMGACVCEGLDAGDALSCSMTCTFNESPLIPSDASFGWGLVAGPGTLGIQHDIAFAFDSGNAFQTFPIRPLLLGTHEVLMYGRDVFVADNVPQSSDPSVIAVSEPQFTQFCIGIDPAGPDAGLCLGPIMGGPACAPYAACGSYDPCVPCVPDTFDGGDFPSRTSAGLVRLNAVAIGTAEIVLAAGDGSTIDRLPLDVHPAARLFSDTMSATMVVRQTLEMRVYALDAAGVQLEARYGITATSDAPNVAVVAEHQTFPTETFGVSVESYDIDVRALERGTANVTFVANHASTTVPVTVE